MQIEDLLNWDRYNKSLDVRVPRPHRLRQPQPGGHGNLMKMVASWKGTHMSLSLSLHVYVFAMFKPNSPRLNVKHCDPISSSLVAISGSRIREPCSPQPAIAIALTEQRALPAGSCCHRKRGCCRRLLRRLC